MLVELSILSYYNVYCIINIIVTGAVFLYLIRRTSISLEYGYKLQWTVVRIYSYTFMLIQALPN